MVRRDFRRVEIQQKLNKNRFLPEREKAEMRRELAQTPPELGGRVRPSDIDDSRPGDLMEPAPPAPEPPLASLADELENALMQQNANSVSHALRIIAVEQVGYWTLSDVHRVCQLLKRVDDFIKLGLSSADQAMVLKGVEAARHRVVLRFRDALETICAQAGSRRRPAKRKPAKSQARRCAGRRRVGARKSRR
jgi:hypothetical protein